MKIFNVEEKNNNKELVCYIQVKDLDFLKEQGINLDVYNNINEHLYLFNKKALKSFIRINNTEDILKIKNNNGCILDFTEFLKDEKNSLVKYTDELNADEKKIKTMEEEFLNTNLVYLGNLRENPQYREIIKKKKLYSNKLEDIKDIRDFTKGYDSINLPQEPFVSGIISRLNDITLYKGINPNEYIILSMNGDNIPETTIEEIKRNKYNYLNEDILPEFIINNISSDVKVRNQLNNLDYDDVNYEYMVSDDKKYLIVRVNNNYVKSKSKKL